MLRFHHFSDSLPKHESEYWDQRYLQQINKSRTRVLGCRLTFWTRMTKCPLQPVSWESGMRSWGVVKQEFPADSSVCHSLGGEKPKWQLMNLWEDHPPFLAVLIRIKITKLLLLPYSFSILFYSFSLSNSDYRTIPRKSALSDELHLNYLLSFLMVYWWLSIPINNPLAPLRRLP